MYFVDLLIFIHQINIKRDGKVAIRSNPSGLVGKQRLRNLHPTKLIQVCFISMFNSSPENVENKIWQASRFTTVTLRLGLASLIVLFLMLVGVLGPDLVALENKIIESQEQNPPEKEETEDVIEIMQHKKDRRSPISKMTKVHN